MKPYNERASKACKIASDSIQKVFRPDMNFEISPYGHGLLIKIHAEDRYNKKLQKATLCSVSYIETGGSEEILTMLRELPWKNNEKEK